MPSTGTLRQFVFYFLRLGTFGFGGPVTLAARMQKDLVEELTELARLASLSLRAAPTN